MIRSLLPWLALSALVAGCRAPDDGTVAAVDDGYTSTVQDAELESALVLALGWAATSDVTLPWLGLNRLAAMGDGACPAGYSGEPPGVDVTGTGAVGAGGSWVGSCETSSATWRGYMYWEDAYTGSMADGAARLLVGDGSVTQGDTNLFEFDGDATDRYSERTTADGGHLWEYEATINATMSGSLIYDPATSPTPGGVQEDLFVYYTGGAEATFEAYGNLYLFEDVLYGRYDSVFLDVELAGPGTDDPDACLTEPKGTIGLRDVDGHWYYVVFEPKYNSTLDYENDPYSGCDGCGTTYFRGFEQEARVCPDFSSLWSVLGAPTAAEFSP